MATTSSISASPFRTPQPSPWLQALVANVQDAIVILDAEGRLIFENPSASQILGIPSDDVLGTFGLSRIHRDDRDAVVRSFRRTIMLPGAISRATYRFQRADGNWQHLEALAKNLVDDPEIRGVLITFRDVSERVRAVEAAESANRARDEFLYNIAKELRSPINAMIACADLPLEEENDQSRLLVQLRQHGAHLLRLVEQAVDLAGVRTGFVDLQMEPVCLDSLLADTATRWKASGLRMDVGITLDLSCGDAVVVGDRSRLSKLFLDLVDGLARLSHHGGQIKLVSAAGPEQIQVSISSGSGELSERHIQDVFDRFDRMGMGLEDGAERGLGLAIAGRLIELMGGSMGIETTQGGAAEIWLQLPRGESATAQSG